VLDSGGPGGGSIARPEKLKVRPSRRSEVTRELRAAIVSGQMLPGAVYSAPTLAARFGVSPTPVREAMLDLAKEGLVEVVRNKGFRVVVPSEEDLDQILELRMMLEVPAVTKIAAVGVPEAVLDELGRLADETLRCAEDRDAAGHVTADTDFHMTLLAQSRNGPLVDIVRVLRAKTRLCGLGVPEREESLVECSRDHGRLVTLLRARDVCGVQDLMARHISSVGEMWERGGGDS
jgi:DNA-binding GntR family transcriptional regulator